MGHPKVVPQERQCEVCGVGFLVGGRGRPPYEARYCSKRCAGITRRIPFTAGKLSPTEAAYLAGMIDGEGSIVAVMKRDVRTTWRLTVCSTTRPVIDWCLATTGCGTIVVATRRESNHAAALYWQCYSWNAKRILEQCLPYMIIKREKAIRLIAELNSV